LLLGKKQANQNASTQVPAVHKHSTVKLVERVNLVACINLKQLHTCASCRLPVEASQAITLHALQQRHIL
jgi:hypothetical protein